MARQFANGSSQYLTLDDGGALDGLTALTVAFWFTCDTNNTFYMLLGRWYYNWAVFQGSGWCIHHHNSLGLRSEVAYDGTPNTDDLREGSVSIGAGEWHHAALTWATNYRALYLDGVEVDNDSNSRTSITNKAADDVLYIAAEHTSTGLGNYHDGDIAEVGIWLAALSAAEVATLARGYSPLLVRPQSLSMCLPLVRDDDNDPVGGWSWTPHNSPTIDAHPRILRPSHINLGIPTAEAPPPAGAQLLALLGVGG